MIRKIILGTYCFLSLILFVFPTSAQQPMDEINGLLDRWHKTSGEVKYGPFLNVIASDGVILGPDHDEGGIKPMRRSSAINISIQKMLGLTPMTSGISVLMPIVRRPGLMKRLRSIPSPFVAWAY